MRRLWLQKALCCVLALIFPGSLFAADATALLYISGTGWLNGSSVPRSSAIFSGDLIQTKSNSIANINARGSNITILADSLVQFEGDSLRIEHGAVSVATSSGLATRAGEVKVAPVAERWTEFEVAHVDGSVKIAARKGDVNISDSQGTTTLLEGQEATRDDASDTEKEKNRKRSAGSVPDARGPWLDHRLALVLGTAAVGAVTGWVLAQDDDPVSPDRP